jgi:hypothetical protein
VIPVRVPADAKPVLASERRFAAGRGHPLDNFPCPVCGGPLGEQVIVLVLAGIAPEDRKPAGWTTGGAVAVHAACAGVPEQELETPPRTVTFDLTDSDTFHVLTTALEDYAGKVRDRAEHEGAGGPFARWARLAKRMKRQAEAAAG